MKTIYRVAFAAFVLASCNLSSATLYVALDSPNPTPPYTNWATAARVIQDAVDAAHAGDTVLVTNGVYATGGRRDLDEDGILVEPSGRVVVLKAITVTSINGPAVTRIMGSRSTNSQGQTEGIRCAVLRRNAVLSGFTLTNGTAYNYRRGQEGLYGGGVHSDATGQVQDCVLTGNEAMNGGGGASGGVLRGCVIKGNGAGKAGGGAYRSTLEDCTLVDNHNTGASGCTLSNCTLSGNKGIEGAGGASGSTLHHCTLSGNIGGTGGGSGASGSTLFDCTLNGNVGEWCTAEFCTLYNCTVNDNWGSVAVAQSVLYNCIVRDNPHGGVFQSKLMNCVVVGNGAAPPYPRAGGIVEACVVFNSIAYYNYGGNYDDLSLLSFCCTTPLPGAGTGNVTSPPLFMDMAAGDFRLREDSPCIDAGANLLGIVEVTNIWGDITGVQPPTTDILGNTRFIDGDWDGKVVWDIGACEFNSFKPPRFSVAPQRITAGWRLNITGAPEKWAQLERSGNLRDWEVIWTGWMGTEGAAQVNDWYWDTGPEVMSYRVVVP